MHAQKYRFLVGKFGNVTSTIGIISYRSPKVLNLP